MYMPQSVQVTYGAQLYRHTDRCSNREALNAYNDSIGGRASDDF